MGTSFAMADLSNFLPLEIDFHNRDMFAVPVGSGLGSPGLHLSGAPRLHYLRFRVAVRCSVIEGHEAGRAHIVARVTGGGHLPATDEIDPSALNASRNGSSKLLRLTGRSHREKGTRDETIRSRSSSENTGSVCYGKSVNRCVQMPHFAPM